MKRHRERITAVLIFVVDLCLIHLWIATYFGIHALRVLRPYGQPELIPRLAFLALAYLTLVVPLILAGAYRMPRRWGVNEALPVITKAMIASMPVLALVFAFSGSSVTEAGLKSIPRGGVGILTYGGLAVSLMGVRLLLGRAQLALYRRGIGVRRAVVVDCGVDTERVVARVERNPWIGERFVGRIGDASGPGWLGKVEDLSAIIRGHEVDVIWLTPGSELYLPSLLFKDAGQNVIWRVLPEHFERISTGSLSGLSQQQRKLVLRRLQHNLTIPMFSVAMLGSRGVPASYSGVEKYVEEVGSRHVAYGARVVVYCVRKYVQIRGNYRGMELRFVPAIRSKHLEKLSHTLLATLHTLVHEEEVIHYQATASSTFAWLPRLFGRRVVVTVQGIEWQRARWGSLTRLYLRFGEWAASRFPHETIVVSKILGNYYAERYGKRPVFIPNGFTQASSRSANRITAMELRKDDYILSVGRLVPEKEFHTLLHAFARVRTNKQLVIAGAATYEDDYVERLQTEARSTNRVTFLGFVRDEVLQELYSNAYLVVHPSAVDGMALALIDAIAYGNCVLVSNVPANLEVIHDCGYSFQVRDGSDLARQLQQLLDEPHRVEVMRERARWRGRFLKDWCTVAQETRMLYEGLLKSSQGV